MTVTHLYNPYRTLSLYCIISTEIIFLTEYLIIVLNHLGCKFFSFLVPLGTKYR